MDEELSALLILAYLMEINHPWPVALGPLQPSFMKLWGLPLTVGLMWMASVWVIEGHTSTAI